MSWEGLRPVVRSRRLSPHLPKVSFVPVIDLDGWCSGDETARRRVALAFDVACRDTGFLQIVGHRVPKSVRAGVRDAADAFCALEKRRSAASSPRRAR